MQTGRIRKPMIAYSLAFLGVLPGCNYNNNTSDNNVFQTFPLVADTLGYQARIVDKNLTNPWGMALTDAQRFWVAGNHSGVSTIYNGAGEIQGSPVTIPSADSGTPGAPTGLVQNTTIAFKVPGTSDPAKFLFAGEDGSVSAWSSGASAKIVINRSADSAVYKGITIALDSGRPFLYLTNFRGRRVEVFDTAFKRDTVRLFADTSIPAGFGPFNIARVDFLLYVTYAKLGPGGEDDEAGVGNGYVNVFTPRGTLVRRFASQGSLNSPWGMTQSTGSFGPFRNAFFVGNFGDGHILGFNVDGKLIGEVSGAYQKPTQLEGLWEILWVPAGTITGLNRNALYYTAGPADETHGVFGYLVHP